MEVDESESINEKQTIQEGSATILSKGNVFYNPVQQFNRDLSICVLATFFELYKSELKTRKTRFKQNDDKLDTESNSDNPSVEQKNEDSFTILEALSATGLRSIRYAKEVPGIKRIIANDISQQAVEAIKVNLKNNNVDHIVNVENMDACTLMYLATAPKNRFTVIDLDPYGCPSRFLNGAVQSIEEGGLLLVTATDMAVLAGNTPESCYVKYGAIPLKTKSCHEMALRILLKCIESHATIYGRYIVPLLSISADFYIRVFVRIFTSPKECKRSTSKQSTVYLCAGCDTITLHPLGILKPNPSEKNPQQIKYALSIGPPVNTNCEFCKHRHHIGGPIWTDPIHDIKFVASLLETLKQPEYAKLVTIRRMVGMLTVVQEELPDVPLYYAIENLCSVLKLETIPILKLRSSLLHAGYKVSFSHACKSSVKTNANASVLWDILRCWAKTHPVKPERFIDGTPLKAILSKESSIEYNFHDIHPLANPPSRKDALSRFPENPASHWGPSTRATLLIYSEMGENKCMKQIKNQNKKKRYNNKTEPESPNSTSNKLKQAKLE